MVSTLSREAQPNLGKGPPYGTNDGRHLHGFVNLAILNLILNLARAAADGVQPYGGWHSGAGGAHGLGGGRQNRSAAAGLGRAERDGGLFFEGTG